MMGEIGLEIESLKIQHRIENEGVLAWVVERRIRERVRAERAAILSRLTPVGDWRDEVMAVHYLVRGWGNAPSLGTLLRLERVANAPTVAVALHWRRG